ncbi:MAG: hypothetical protein B6U69_02485 [Thermofilum sp. ex4484_15]|nr:MAG: hypothetical protein B6U69_02485 [Thermofilum sp. ex4484_15]
MNPVMGRLLTLMCFVVLMMAILALPNLKSDEPEYVVDLLALTISLIVLILVIIEVRREVSKG